VYVYFYWSGTPRVAIGNKQYIRPAKNERNTAVYNVNWQILCSLHIIIIKITKIMTKTTELYSLKVYNYA